MLGGSMNGWISASPVETLVARACDPSLSEPPFPVHLELAEYINKKKANTYVCFTAPVPRLYTRSPLFWAFDTPNSGPAVS